LKPEERDYIGRVVGTRHPAAHPTRLRKDVVWLGTTCGNHLIAKLARQGQIGEAIAVHMAHLFSAIPVFGAAETMWQGFDARP